MVSRMVYSTWTTQKPTLFDCHYLRNRSTLDIGVLGYIGIVQHKEHSPEVWSIPPGTPCILHLTSHKNKITRNAQTSKKIDNKKKPHWHFYQIFVDSMSSRDSLQRACRLGNFRRQGWDSATHHAMTRLLHIIQQTPHNILPDTTVILPGCHELVQIIIQVFLDVTLRCCMWHQCHSKFWKTLSNKASHSKGYAFSKKPTTET